MRHLVDRIVIWESGDAGPTVDETSQNVLLDSAIDHGDVEIAMWRADVKRSLGADLADKVDLFGIDKGLVLVGIVFFTDGDPGKRGSLLSKIGHNGSSINARDGRDTLPCTPFAQAFDGSPVTVLLRDVCHHDSDGLNIWRLEILQQTIVVTGGGWNPVISDERLSKDQNLAAV